LNKTWHTTHATKVQHLLHMSHVFEERKLMPMLDEGKEWMQACLVQRALAATALKTANESSWAYSDAQCAPAASKMQPASTSVMLQTVTA
jgi:hypothetical protein